MKAQNLNESIRAKLDKQFNLYSYTPMQCLLDIDKILDFYSQPFSVEMLVNPICDLTKGKVLDEKGMKYNQAEQKRLFEGWEKTIGNDAEIHRTGDFSITIGKTYVKFYSLMECAEFARLPQSLNDFITLCNLAGIELDWNENNEFVKEKLK